MVDFKGLYSSSSRIIRLPVACPIINELSTSKKDKMADGSPIRHCVS